MNSFIFFFCAVPKRCLEIVELADLEKEYLLVDARLRLIKKDADLLMASGSYYMNFIVVAQKFPSKAMCPKSDKFNLKLGSWMK